MPVRNGSAILLKSGSNVVGASRSLSISVQNNLIDISSKDSVWKKRKYGRKQFNISVGGVVDLTDLNGQVSLHDATKDGSSISFTIGPDTPSTGDITLSGSGLCDSWEESYPDAGEATYTGSIQGNGALTKTTN